MKNHDRATAVIKFAILIILFSALSLQSKPYNILDGESPYTLPQRSLQTRIMLGYESGYIPDVFVRPWLDLGLWNWLTLGGGIYYTWFPEQHRNMLSEWEVRGKVRVLEISPGSRKYLGFFKYGGTALYGYAKFRKSEKTIIEREILNHRTLQAVSPRADGGWDIVAGGSTRTEFSVFGQNFGVFMTADYAWTGGRKYYPTEAKYQNRLRANVMPAYYVNFVPTRFVDRDSLLLGVQNRFTYWFERGSMYEVMPQVTWEFRKNMSVSVGVSIPATSRNDYRVLVEFSALFELSPLSAGIEVDPDDDFTPDGNGIHDVLYLEPTVKSKEPVREWSVQIKDGRRVIKTFRGAGIPREKIAWNGRTDSNYMIESLKEYDVVLRVVDVRGNRDGDDTSFTSGLILEKIPNGYKIVMSNIEFETGRDRIGRQSSRVLRQIADYLEEHYKNYRVRIEGHTDNVGGKAYNQGLSLRRAKSVMEYLAGRGIDRERMAFNGLGETDPISDNDTEEGKARNRRVEFILQKHGR